MNMWRAPIDTLGKAGRALEGMEALLGGGAGGTFDLKVSQKADSSLVSLQPHLCHADTTSPQINEAGMLTACTVTAAYMACCSPDTGGRMGSLSSCTAPRRGTYGSGRGG